MPSGQRTRAPEGTPLLDVARQAGVEIESLCAGRLTCGRCQIVVEADGVVTAPDAGESELLARRGCDEDRRLSCSARVLADAVVSVPDEAQAHKQVVRKDAGREVVDLLPAVRQVYVTVDEAALDDARGDWERLRSALAEQWGLEGLEIDPLVLRGLQRDLRAGAWAVTVAVRHSEEVVDCRPGYAEGCYGVAVDVGSTTIAAYLCDLRTGAVLATETLSNPQIVRGEDLMSRVAYAMSDGQGTARLHEALIDGLNYLVEAACARSGILPSEVVELVAVGNTVMHHLLLGMDPSELGGAPFALATHDPVEVKARDLNLRLHPAAYLHVPPCVAGHVGADNVAVLVAEAPHERAEPTLVIDVGTNAEILLGDRRGVWSASSPTGPAFEGAQITHGMRAALGAIERVRIDPETGETRVKVLGSDAWSDEPGAAAASGICGSGIIEAVAELYLAGIIDAGGRFAAGGEGPRWRWQDRVPAYVLATAEQTTTGREIVVTQQDVRAIQLAKAALYAGVRLLMGHAGIERVERVLLAGAFGSYIDPRYAMVLGLFPDCSLDRVHAVGNAAGDGARILLLDRDQRAQAAELARSVHYVETAVDPGFQDAFVAAMSLPHASDPFPHLAGVLPPVPPSSAPRASRGGARRAAASGTP